MDYSELVELIKEYNATPKKVLDNKDIMNMYIPIFKADLTLADYINTGDNIVLPCDVSILHGKYDSTVEYDDMLDWANRFDGIFESKKFDGGIFF
jgi:surfactin synthase thioesterase subunit